MTPVGTDDAQRSARPKRRLIEGRMMRCPRCKQLHDILAYVPLRVIPEFASETTPIYKCPNCRWQFAPCIDEEVIREWLLQRTEEKPAEKTEGGQ